MKKESFQRAEDEIKNYFADHSQAAFTEYDLQQVFEVNRSSWKIAGYRTSKHFQKFLEERKILELEQLEHHKTKSLKKIWKKKEVGSFEVGLNIKKEGYLSNFSAMQYHQLTLQFPKSVYISVDKYGTDNNEREFPPQENIDSAFSKPQRTTSDIYKSQMTGFRYYFLQKKIHSVDVGVQNVNQFRITNLERTLIDIAIRPAYSGGVFEVLNAFVQAKSNVDSQKLLFYLEELNYLYPYHQLIGFYLDRANFSAKAQKMFLDKISSRNFYLTYNMSNPDFDKKWKIFYPKGF